VNIGNSDSAVGIANGWTTEGPEFESSRFKNFRSFISSRPALGAHPACYPKSIGGSFT
jgi:hypothetical protein